MKNIENGIYIPDEDELFSSDEDEENELLYKNMDKEKPENIQNNISKSLENNDNGLTEIEINDVNDESNLNIDTIRDENNDNRDYLNIFSENFVRINEDFIDKEFLDKFLEECLEEIINIEEYKDIDRSLLDTIFLYIRVNLVYAKYLE
jgi:hypothetical protein